MAERKFSAILSSFAHAGVEFVVVGGLAAVLNGAPVNTYDVDLVHARDTANIRRLLQVLENLDAIFRIQPHRRLKPNASHLIGPGHLNLITRYGPLDLLGTVGQGLGYEDLAQRATEKKLLKAFPLRSSTFPP